MKYKKSFKFLSIFLITVFLPITAFAATCLETYRSASGGKLLLGTLLNYIACTIGSSIIPLIFALAMATFIWGVVQYVINNDDESKKTKGKQFMIWGIIGLAVMVSVWGLVGILGNTFGIKTVIPQLSTDGKKNNEGIKINQGAQLQDLKFKTGTGLKTGTDFGTGGNQINTGGGQINTGGNQINTGDQINIGN